MPTSSALGHLLNKELDIMTNEQKLTLDIIQWAAWAPTIETQDDWENWANKPCMTYGNEMPDVSSLPAMQRRRMNRLSRMCYSVVQQIDSSAHLPQIYCSCQGDLTRSSQLLSDLARSEPLSSTSFALSVHNAVGGAVSILQGNTQPITSVAAGENGIRHAFYEVLSHLVEFPELILVVYEEVVPELYAIKNSPVFAYALHIKRGHSIELNFNQSAAARSPFLSELDILSQIIQGLSTLNFK